MINLPTRIFYGSGAVGQAEEQLLRLGSRSLIVTGSSSAKRSGALNDIMAVLEKGNKHWQLFDRVPENPDLESVVAGAELVIEEDLDFVIGIGGGSPLDAAKAIALVAANRLGRAEIYQVDRFAFRMPVVAIPTTAGTGSEVTQYAVLTDPQSRRKAGFTSSQAFPDLALCDPAYTLSLPPRVTLHSAIDALSHLLEGIYSNRRDPLNYPLIHTGAGLILTNLRRALDDPENLEARGALMRAALYGGVSIAGAGTTLQHSLGYPLTSHLGLPHGLSNGVVLRQVMELYYPFVGEALEELFRSVGLSREGFFLWLEQWELRAGQALKEDFIARSVQEVMASRNMANNPFPVREEQVAEIYRSLG